MGTAGLMPAHVELPARVDLAVIGGGPGGTAAAVTAAREGMRVALLTSGPPRTARAGESLPPGGEVLLEEIFGENAFDPDGHLLAYGTRSVWGSERVDDNEFVFNPFGSGWHLDRRVFDEGLLATAERLGVRVLRECRVLGAERAPSGWEIASDGSGARCRVHAGSLIDATGRAARIARTLGGRRRWIDRLVAVMWVLGRPSREDTDRTVTVEATRTGWWYTAPVPRSLRLVAFVSDPVLLPARTKDKDAVLTAAPAAIAEAARAGGYRTRSTPFATDASAGFLDPVCGDRWWAVGDAAVCFDPLSSQGIASALLTGREAGFAAAGRTSEDAFTDLCTALWDEHVARRAAYYASERRWAREAFWTRGGGSLVGA